MKMAAKETENQQWSDPKDFGLPFVEVKAISKKTETLADKSSDIPVTKEKTKKKVLESVAPSQEAEDVKLTENQSSEVAQVKKESSKEVKVKPVSTRSDSPVSKSSTTWIWIVIFLAIAVVSVIVWQLMGNSSDQGDKTSKGESEISAVKETPPTPEPTANLSGADTTQNSSKQDSLAVGQDSNLNISKPAESGTTIANTEPGNLIRIDSKGPRTRYFIVVSSLPNEKLALEVAGGFAKRSQELYLISPYENSPNYRVAIASFDSWNSASNEMARIKSEYTEDLWILNY